MLEHFYTCIWSGMQSGRVDKAAAPEESSKNTKESKAAKKAERVIGINGNQAFILCFAPWCQRRQPAMMSPFCYMAA